MEAAAAVVVGVFFRFSRGRESQRAEITVWRERQRVLLGFNHLCLSVPQVFVLHLRLGRGSCFSFMFGI